MKSPDGYKKQATRLAMFMQERFRIKVNRTSALEAIAVIAGMRNWQTLLATAGTESKKVVAAVQHRYALAWREFTGEPLCVSEQDWRRHTLVSGTTAARENWFHRQIVEHLSTGRSGIFVELPQESIGLLTLEHPQEKGRSWHTLCLQKLGERLEVEDSAAVFTELAERVATTPGVWCITEACSREQQELLPDLLNAVAHLKAQQARDGFTFAALNEHRFACMPDQVLRQGRAFGFAALVGVSLASSSRTVDSNTYNTVNLSGVTSRMTERLARMASVGPVVLSGAGQLQA